MIHLFDGKRPNLSPRCRMADTAVVIGDVTVAEDAALWYGAVLRGDRSPISIGRGANVQDNAVIHTSLGFPTTIGSYVSVGHGAIVHGATVEDECIVGMGSILLNGCVVGKGSLVAAGALVPQGMVIPPYSLAVGSPAKVLRSLREEERAGGMISAREYMDLAQAELPLAEDGGTL